MAADQDVSPSKSTTVLIADDSVFMRQVVGDALKATPEIELVGEAADGLEALAQIDMLKPQVVVLDMVMPRLNGFGVLEKVVRLDNPPVIIMLSEYTKQSAEVTADCLSMGAADCVLKPDETGGKSIDSMLEELVGKIKKAAAAKIADPAVQARPQPVQQHSSRKYDIIVIGSSTGGPVALEDLLPRLRAGLSCPVVVAQHLPTQFIETLVLRLASSTELKVKVAEDGDAVETGTIYFAPGGLDTKLVKEADGRVVLRMKPSTAILTPSVDALMSSAAKVYGAATLGIILTGMGEDGVEGIRAIKSAGGFVVVQDAQSSVVYGMGLAVVQNGLADEILSLNQIANKIREL